jgi:hypothetical protein
MVTETTEYICNKNTVSKAEEGDIFN